jgi:hypothetical protein
MLVEKYLARGAAIDRSAEAAIEDQQAALMTAWGQSLPGRASSKSGHVRCSGESGSKFRALAALGRAIAA